MLFLRKVYSFNSANLHKFVFTLSLDIMFKYLLTFFLFVTYLTNAQIETFSEKNIGSTGSFTSQPVSLQSEFSHSQTIYYAQDLEFKGEINLF